MDKQCNIVQDLIPLVVDQIASDESVILVEEHIKTCEECSKMFSLSKDSVLDDNTEKNRQDKKVLEQVAKKQKNKRRKSIIISVVVAFAVFTIIISAYQLIHHGITTFTKVTMSDSNRFTQEELNDAKQAVMEEFEESYASCIMLRLDYEEQWSQAYLMEKEEDSNDIIFSSSYYICPWKYHKSLLGKTNHNYIWQVTYIEATGRWHATKLGQYTAE